MQLCVKYLEHLKIDALSKIPLCSVIKNPIMISMIFAYQTNLNISRMKQGNKILWKMLLCQFKCSYRCNYKKMGWKCINTKGLFIWEAGQDVCRDVFHPGFTWMFLPGTISPGTTCKVSIISSRQSGTERLYDKNCPAFAGSRLSEPGSRFAGTKKLHVV